MRRRSQRSIRRVDLQSSRTAANQAEGANHFIFGNPRKNKRHARMKTVGESTIGRGNIKPLGGKSRTHHHLGRSTLTAPQSPVFPGKAVIVFAWLGGHGANPAFSTAYFKHAWRFGVKGDTPI